MISRRQFGKYTAKQFFLKMVRRDDFLFAEYVTQSERRFVCSQVNLVKLTEDVSCAAAEAKFDRLVFRAEKHEILQKKELFCEQSYSVGR